MADVWCVDRLAGLTILRCTPLSDIPGLAHAFSTREVDGREDFDLGGGSETDVTILERRRRFLVAAGLGSALPFVLQQVHGAEIVAASSSSGGVRADAAWWSDRRDARAVPAVRTADCVGLLLADRRGGAGVAVHAGWRGTAASIPRRAVETMTTQGSPPSELVAALGPAIGPCCYEVGDEVVGAIGAVTPGGAAPGRTGENGGFFLDLRAAVARQLEGAGVVPKRIHSAPWCTRCRADWFFSYRRDGAAAGRLMAALGALRESGGRA